MTRSPFDDDNSEIASAWIDYHSRPHAADEEAHEDAAWWAVDAMMTLVRRDPLRALEICFRVARLSASAWVLENLGAGPLEDLLSDDPILFDAIAFEAKSNGNLVDALRGMWQSTIPNDVWSAVQGLIGAS
jgi:hypothetical protein